MSLRIPHIRVDFASVLNSHAEQAEAGTRAFVARFGLAPDEAARRHHERSLLGTLMGRAYPQADARGLQLVTDWISCMLVLDDQFDETALGADPTRLREVCDEVLSWLTVDGSVDEAPSDAPGASITSVFRPAYADLWRRTAPVTSRAWRSRFAGHIADFFETCVWESQNRLTGRVPDLDEYIALRGRALMPYLDLIEVTTHAEVPEEIYGLPEFAELNATLSDADLWTNDLFSCEKEALLNDPHNLVLVHRHTHGCDLQTSADAVGAMIQDRFDRFDALSGAFADRLSPALHTLFPRDRLERHLAGLRSWLTGQLEWRFETQRFDPTRPEVTSAAGSTPLVTGSAL